jgi:hypothetical protein
MKIDKKVSFLINRKREKRLIDAINISLMAISDILLDRNINYDCKQLEFPNQ